MSDAIPNRDLIVPTGRYLTPDNNPTDTVCRILRLPNDLKILAAVNEVLALLLFTDIWDETAGGLSADDTTDLMAVALIDYWRSDCMIGAIMPFVTSETPENALLCDGSTYLKADYPALYEKLDSAYIVDADSFVVPDLRGQFVLGASAAHPALSSGGTETHTLTTDELPAHDHTTQPHTHTTQPHNHSYNYPTINLDLEAPGAPDITGAGNPPVPTVTSSTVVQVDQATVQVDQTGGGQAHNNMPPYTALNYYIIAR